MSKSDTCTFRTSDILALIFFYFRSILAAEGCASLWKSKDLDITCYTTEWGDPIDSWAPLNFNIGRLFRQWLGFSCNFLIVLVEIQRKIFSPSNQYVLYKNLHWLNLKRRSLYITSKNLENSILTNYVIVKIHNFVNFAYICIRIVAFSQAHDAIAFRTILAHNRTNFLFVSENRRLKIRRSGSTSLQFAVNHRTCYGMHSQTVNRWGFSHYGNNVYKSAWSGAKIIIRAPKELRGRVNHLFG